MKYLYSQNNTFYRKRDALTRELHHFSDKFSSVTGLKVKLLDQFGAQFPATTLFNLGYFDGRQSMMVCICSQDDLDKMYTTLASAKKREVLLQCDGRAEDGNSQKRVSIV